MKKTLVACGCSFTKDNYQQTWADFLSKELDYDLVNIGARGAGIDFISKRLITHLSTTCNENIIVAIMLPSADRFDFYVDSAHPQKLTYFEISSWQNGETPNLVNLNGELSSDQGYCLTGGMPRGPKKYWYKHFYNETFTFINYWFSVLAIQNYLKLQNIKYFLIPAYNIDDLIEQESNKHEGPKYTNVLNLIDFDNFIFYNSQSGFLQYTKDNNFPTKNHHPAEIAHQSFVENIILPKIC